jgi:hypothetical protein
MVPILGGAAGLNESADILRASSHCHSNATKNLSFNDDPPPSPDRGAKQIPIGWWNTATSNRPALRSLPSHNGCLQQAKAHSKNLHGLRTRVHREGAMKMQLIHFINQKRGD